MAKKEEVAKEEKEETAAQTKSSGGVTISKGVLVVGVIIVAVAAFVLLTGNRGGGGSSTTGYFAVNPTTQCRQVPYQDTEAYQEQECQNIPYTDRECESKPLTYSKTNYQCSRGGLIGDWSVAECTVNNLDSEGGTFTVNIGVVVNGNNVGEQQSQFIYPQSSQHFKYSAKADMSTCYCNEVSVPTKQVCRDVIKTRQECNTATKYRPVTKYREECG